MWRGCLRTVRNAGSAARHTVLLRHYVSSTTTQSNWGHWLKERVFLSPMRCSELHLTSQRWDEDSPSDVVPAQRDALRRPVIQDSTLTLPPHAALLSAQSLLDFISQSQDEPPATIYSIDHIRDLYHQARVDGPPHSFTAQAYTALIRLLGALSVSTFDSPYASVFKHSFVPHMPEASYHQHWDIIEQIAEDKRRAGFPFQNSDRYWLMRASLARMQMQKEEKPGYADDCRTPENELFHSARSHYHTLRRRNHPDIHVAYLQPLLYSSVQEHQDEAIQRLCELVDRIPQCHPRVLALLWHVVLGMVVSDAIKIRILSLLHGRLSRASSQSTVDTGVPVPNSSPKPSGTVSSQSYAGVGVKVLAAHLLDAIVGVYDPKADDSRGSLNAWARSLASTVMSLPNGAGTMHDTRWSCLVLLAIAHASGEQQPISGGITVQSVSIDAVAQWQTICSLASLENSFCVDDQSMTSPITADLVQGVKHILEILWSRWVETAVNHTSDVARSVDRVICSSFLWFAARLGDRKLFTTINNFSSARQFWLRDPGDLLQSSAVRVLGVAHLSGLVLHRTRIEAAIISVADRVDCSMLTDVVNNAIHVWARSDAEVAREMYAVARHAQVNISNDAIVGLAIGAANSGLIQLALEYLTNTRLDSEQHLTVLGSIISVLVQQGHRFRSAYFTSSLGEMLLKQLSFSSPPSSMRADLTRALVLMPRYDQSANAVAILEAIVQANPQYFLPSFYGMFAWELLAHYQFRSVERLHDLAQSLGFGDALPSDRVILTHFVEAGTSDVALRFARKLSRDGTKISFIVKVTRAHPLKLPTLLQHSECDTLSARLITQRLVRAGRMRAAKQIYGQYWKGHPQEIRTLVGNDILHGALQDRSKRNARRMRRVLLTLNELMRNFDFKPDRVTVNILLKALMGWTSVVTSEKLRALFDHMVRSGYPTGGVASPTAVPFGSTLSVPNLVDIPKVDAELSFFKHVRPLYKMFIKAFRARGDAAGGSTIVGILKAAKAEALDAKEVEDIARSVVRQRTRRMEGIREKLERSQGHLPGSGVNS